MIELIFLIEFCLGTLGLTYIITVSKLLKPIRERLTTYNLKLGSFATCPQCVGFYSGFCVYLLLYYNLSILVYAFTSSFLAYIINKNK